MALFCKVTNPLVEHLQPAPPRSLPASPGNPIAFLCNGDVMVKPNVQIIRTKSTAQNVIRANFVVEMEVASIPRLSVIILKIVKMPVTNKNVANKMKFGVF